MGSYIFAEGFFFYKLQGTWLNAEQEHLRHVTKSF